MEAIRSLMTCLIVAALMCSPTGVFAQDPPPDAEGAADAAEEDDVDVASPGEIVLWDIRGVDAARLDAFRKGVSESLADAASNHVLSAVAFAEYIKRRAPGPPSCLRGVSDCVAPSAIVFDALDLSSLVRVDIIAVGANYDVIDARGRSVRRGEVVEPDARKLGFAVVRAVFDATGVVTIDSQPQGATVELDGHSVGTTPLTYRVAVGEHTYRVRAPGRTPMDGTLTVTAGKGVMVMHDLNPTPGTLVIKDAPAGAEVHVDGKLVGVAGEPIPLGPGVHSLEIRAKGFETMRENVTIEPGLVLTRSTPLVASSAFLKEFSSDAIAFNNYILRLGFEYGLQRATFQDARSSDDIPYEFISIADANGNLPGGGLALHEQLNTVGLRLDASYGLKRFGIVALSLSYLSRGVDFDGFVGQRGGPPELVTLTSVKRLQVRPFQFFYRYFYRNFVPFAEAGIGINFSWLKVEGSQFDGAKTLRRTDALWTIGIGGQYYFTPNFFAVGRYSLQDYFENGLGTDHQFSIGFGAAFPNLFGFDPEPPAKL